MNGSLQAKHGQYFVVARIPDETGNTKPRWIPTGVSTEGNNKRIAEKRKREILVEIEQKKIIYSSKVLFVDLIGEWLAKKKCDLKENSFESLESYVEHHIIPYFKPLKLSVQDVEARHIQDYYDFKRQSGLSWESIKKHRSVIRNALQTAVMPKKLIPYNPAESCILGKSEKYVGAAYTEEQSNKLLAAIADDPMEPIIVFGLYYGLRRSEILGIRWRDIDFGNDSIIIKNTVVWSKTIVEQEKTKSQASARTFVIVPETKDYFQALKRRQAENRLLLGNAYHVSDKVCVKADGTEFQPGYVSKRYAELLKKYSLPHIRLHDLRHTGASVLLRNGASVKQVQEFMGHAKPDIALAIYTHLTDEDKRETAQIMGRILNRNAV